MRTIQLFKRMIVVSMLLLLVLSGCSSGSSQPKGLEGLNQGFLGVELSTDPQRIMPGDTVTFISKVTLDDEPVENADEVLYEFWADGHQDQSEKILGEHEGDGIYTIQRTYEEAGVYYVVSHVTLREMHNMPRLKLVVGDVPGEDPNQEPEEHDGDMSNMHHDTGEHGGH